MRQFATGVGDGEDFYAPMPGGEIARCLFALACMWQVSLAVLDFSVAFMHTPLPTDDLIFIWPPAHIDTTCGTVWCLRKALNGLRISAKAFGDFLKKVLTELGWTQSKLQPNLYMGPNGMRLSHHIDDALVLGMLDMIGKFVIQLGLYIKVKSWSVINQVEPTEYVGGSYWRTPAGGIVEASLPGYIRSIAAIVGLESCMWCFHTGSYTCGSRQAI